MEKFLKEFKKNNTIISCAYLLNVLMLILISTGALGEGGFLKVYFFLAISFIPLILLIVQLYLYKKYDSEIKSFPDIRKDFFSYLPHIFFGFIFLMFGAKFAIQLDKEVLAEVITISLTFLLADAMMIVMFRQSEYEHKAMTKNYIISFILFLLFVALMIIISFDYSIII